MVGNSVEGIISQSHGINFYAFSQTIWPLILNLNFSYFGYILAD